MLATSADFPERCDAISPHLPTRTLALECLAEEAPATQVYCWCMARTNIDIDEAACRVVMERFQFDTKRDAVNFALRQLASQPLDLPAARDMRGTGWDGDLETMRAGRIA